MHVLLRLTGITGMVMHNPRLADKRDPYTKAIAEITSKRKKTDADENEIERLEWFGGLYHESEIGVYVPTYNVVRCLERAGTITREGSTIVRALAVFTDKVPLIYDGPREPEKLWEKPEYRLRRILGVQRAKVARMRPIFYRWAVEMEAELLEDVMNPENFAQVARMAGRSEGLMDARKLGYGRFESEVIAA